MRLHQHVLPQHRCQHRCCNRQSCRGRHNAFNSQYRLNSSRSSSPRMLYRTLLQKSSPHWYMLATWRHVGWMKSSRPITSMNRLGTSRKWKREGGQWHSQGGRRQWSNQQRLLANQPAFQPPPTTLTGMTSLTTIQENQDPAKGSSSQAA